MTPTGEDTDLAGLATRHGSSPSLRGYLARPAGEGPWPGVVLVHEAFGLDDQSRRHADHLARLGYLVLAPDLFTRGRTLHCVAATFRALGSGRGPAFADIEAARSRLLEDPACTGAVGVIGFCMGGGFALLLAGRGDYAASSVNYGMLPKDPRGVLDAPCPVVASYGGRDRGLAGSADRLERWLAAKGVSHDVREYPGAGHSFLNDAEVGPRAMRPLARVAGVGPDPDAAADAWRRIDAFFGEHLR